MKNSTKPKKIKRKRKRINKEKSIFSTSQNALSPAQQNKGVTFNKPPFKFSEKDKEVLHAVLKELSKSSKLIN